MKRIIGFVMLVIFLATVTANASQPMSTLDAFILRFNECMDILEYEVYYGVDAKLTRKSILIKPGDVNDTAMISFPDYPEGFFMLIFTKNTEDIIAITTMFKSRGASKQPERILEFMAPLAYCGGAIDDPNDVNAAMYEMGMYGQNAFAQGATGLYQGNHGSIAYESTTIGGNELIYAYVEQ